MGQQQQQQQKNKTNINLVYAPALHESLCSSVPGLSCLSACVWEVKDLNPTMFLVLCSRHTDYHIFQSSSDRFRTTQSRENIWDVLRLVLNNFG